MSQTATATQMWVTLVPETCYKCGVAFGVPGDFQKNRLKDHRSFYCPNGHGQVYNGETEEQKKIKKLESDQVWYATRLKQETAAAESARRSLAATKGVLTRTKNKIAAGTCPCCHKEFKVLAKHMANEHPEYATTDETEPAPPLK